VGLEIRCTAYLDAMNVVRHSDDAVEVAGLVVGACDGPLEIYGMTDKGQAHYQTIVATPDALTARLAALGAQLLVDTLPAYLAGTIEPVHQSDEGFTYADKIERADRPIDIESDADAAVRKVRALAPNPAATLCIDGDPHKIFSAKAAAAHLEPGTWAAVEGRPVAAMADGAIELVRLQSPGKKAMSGTQWVLGQQEDHGEIA
jgi:methionyl-tRNA formyltransferase